MIARQPRISTRKRNMIIRAFCTFDMTARMAAEYAGTSRNTANLYYNHIRERIADHLRQAPRLMGEVEMDQTLFGKGMKRSRYDRKKDQAYGDPLFWKRRRRAHKRSNPHKVMVFGIIQRGGKVYAQIIKKADRNTLFPIIHLVVEPNAVVYTDKWAGFNALRIDGYTHHPVNHSLGPVGLDGAHTGNIDAFWSFVKRHLGNFRGIARRTFPLHLKECELRYNVKDKKTFLRLIKLLAFGQKAGGLAPRR